ncbi:ImmA/IrrE family metallo-endopeptidase [Geomonas azotofigens]|uniref:ImmA/IrrE family metallo-endopeptidase n=1 Tax=Geomonas azotofigens TaxID=2843196 RepID=UPI001C0F8303|nr:XRE family transcriptional regulator [Geomonas azotofigens]MBU5614472.1 XRE family transcriptional regulator [Geomonas azotofigens]
MNHPELDFIFGDGSSGDTPDARAISSSLEFVRSQDHLALFSEGATGRKLTAWQAYHSFGLNVLKQVAEDGVAIIVCDESEPGATIKQQREKIGLSLKDLSKEAGITERQVKDAESGHTRSPIQVLEKICTILGLDEQLISFVSGSGGDEALAARLRKKPGNDVVFTAHTVAALHEASWVIRATHKLASWLGHGESKYLPQFVQNSNYGHPGYPAWNHGYYLASKAREILGLDSIEPIKSLRSLCAELLNIPLIQLDLGQRIAGATISNNAIRGIVVNVTGSNDNVWVQRMTIAHELGHLLWDPDSRLQSVKVDTYDELNNAGAFTDFVEQRANAFAVEFLAPRVGVRDIFHSFTSPSEGVKGVMAHFGISYTTACHHIKNSTYGEFFPPEIGDFNPDDEWQGRELFTNVYFPIKSTPSSRRGLFAQYVVESEQKRFISDDTAAAYLGCDDIGEYAEARDAVLSAFS